MKYGKIIIKKLCTDTLEQATLVIKDAGLQGLSVAERKGVEMLITLGTGFGTEIMRDGPFLELSQHPITKKKNYNDYLGKAALEKLGAKKWNKRMRKVIEILNTVFNYDHLYIRGGNSKLIDIHSRIILHLAITGK